MATTVLVDLDGIVADMLKKLLDQYNQISGEGLEPEDVRDFSIKNVVKPEFKEEVDKIYHRDGFYLDLEPIPGAIDTIAGWKSDPNIDVVFCSSPPTPHGAAEKYIWVEHHFGRLGFTHRDVILATKKYHCYGDILIDDRPRNAREFKEKWPNSKVATIAYYYNFDCPAYDLVAGDYRFSELAWKKLDAYVRDMAG